MNAQGTIRIVDRSELVETLLAPLEDHIGSDLTGYRGHIYRVLTYTLHFLNGDETHRRAIETALVYHDVGMWTDRDLAYLQPSIKRALEANTENGWGLDPALIENLILWHHKVFPYRGNHANVVNAVRKGDWIDATGGRVRMGLSRQQIDAVLAAIPEAGFSKTLERLASELGGGSKVRGLSRVLFNVYKW